MSFLVAPLGPLSEFFYLKDYWQPQLMNGWKIGFEDFLFAFCIGGIAGVLYEEIFRKKTIRKQPHRNFSIIIWFAIIGLLWMLIGNLILGINSIYVSASGFILAGIIILILRKDLIKDAFFSAILLGTLALFFYLVFTNIFPGIIQKWWLLHNISGIIILGAPIEEIMWFFGWGLFAGPAYEFVLGSKYKEGPLDLPVVGKV